MYKRVTVVIMVTLFVHNKKYKDLNGILLTKKYIISNIYI